MFAWQLQISFTAISYNDLQEENRAKKKNPKIVGSWLSIPSTPDQSSINLIESLLTSITSAKPLIQA